ncbi:hypothetical protein NW133_07410 [Staphylococcus pettenkoferi]|uniref:Tail assembly chaperone n=1 Tax=Staphylococcus pettenkoferi TaxID=170573 RepID=A0ABT4BL04_9STAP|nr:hypothetical protein [Staphylococcus pettenkoferi]MCY1563814.1 hypothetical protein [Staphylococcus pettenkoferi]MCY1583355.1 hypothetical protein [Staphylococcus pettenkoferi]
MNDKVNIKQVQVNRDGSVEVLNQSNEVTIEPIRPRQFGSLMKIINTTIKDLQGNKDFQRTVQKFFGDYAEGFTLEDLFRDEDFNVFALLDAIGFLLEETPERVIEIIVAMTNIQRELVENQDMDTFFDIIERVIEVNDIEKLVERIKRVSSQMGKAMDFLRANNDEQVAQNVKKS